MGKGRQILDFLFPPTCLLCNTGVSRPHDLCAACFARLPELTANYCMCCGGDSAVKELGCGRCIGDKSAANRAYFPFPYQGEIARLLLGFKFYDRTEWRTLLARLCWERLQEELRWEEPDIIMPIPLHYRRLLSRRYNQSALLARELAKKLHRPLVTNGLKRIKMTQPQTRLSPKVRLENVKGAFQADRDLVRGKTVLLVDDVYTTGATMASAVRELHKAGARRVALLCVARTVDSDSTTP